jgi:peptide/nickel transport system ATP-binding protein
VTAVTESPLMDVRDLRVGFTDAAGEVHAVSGIDLTLRHGETLGIVGESGSGKSATALALTRMLPAAGRISGGRVLLAGTDLLGLDERALRRVRGARIGVVFQDPATSLNPMLTVAEHIAEALRAHRGGNRRTRRNRAVELLELVGIPDPAARLDDYPHQFSGGMRQRVMIALALANEPEVLIADEPTTALDATVQAQLLDLLARLNTELGTAIVLITHNIGVVSRMCARTAVVYAGRVVEEGPTERLLTAPRHPYTISLLRAMPRLDGVAGARLTAIAGQPPDLHHPPAGCAFADRCALVTDRCRTDLPPLEEVAPGQRSACWVTTRQPLPVQPLGAHAASPAAVDTASESASESAQSAAPGDAEPLLRVDAVSKRFRTTRRSRRGVLAVDRVSLTVARGETLGVVGESGCGKSTLARLLLGVHSPSDGRINFAGEDITAVPARRRAELSRDIQMVFQDPYASLNPRMRIGDILAEPLVAHRIGTSQQRREKAAALLRRVGLDPAVADRYPQAFSGGQRQRIGIARAIATDPRLLVCDEPVSALDVSVQAQVINLLTDLQAELGLAMLFISHDLALVRHISHRVAVMYLGRVIELGPASTVSARPLHPYTAALISAAPLPDPVAERGRERIILRGDATPPSDGPAGCPFRARCPVGPRFVAGREECEKVRPELVERPGEHAVACHFPGELAAAHA